MRVAEAWKLGRKGVRRRRATAGGPAGPQGTYRGRLRPRRRAARCDCQPHHRRGGRAAVPARRLLRRHRDGGRPNDARDRGRTVAEPVRRAPSQDVPGLFWLAAVPVHLGAGRAARSSGACSGGSAARSQRRAWSAVSPGSSSASSVSPSVRVCWHSSSRCLAGSAAGRRQRLVQPAGMAAGVIPGASAEESGWLWRRRLERRRGRIRRRRRLGELVRRWTGDAGSGTCSRQRARNARVFTPSALDAIELAIDESERANTVARSASPSSPRSSPTEVWHGTTPRERALEVFAALGCGTPRRTTGC